MPLDINTPFGEEYIFPREALASQCLAEIKNGNHVILGAPAGMGKRCFARIIQKACFEEIGRKPEIFPELPTSWGRTGIVLVRLDNVNILGRIHLLKLISRECKFHYLHRPSEMDICQVLQKEFFDFGKDISVECCSDIAIITNRIPFYIQLLAWHTFQVSSAAVSAQSINQACWNILHHYNAEFGLSYNRLCNNQKSMLAAVGPGNPQPFSKSFIEECGLGSKGQAYGCFKSLVSKGLLMRTPHGSGFQNPFFKLWMIREGILPQSSISPRIRL